MGDNIYLFMNNYKKRIICGQLFTDLTGVIWLTPCRNVDKTSSTIPGGRDILTWITAEVRHCGWAWLSARSSAVSSCYAAVGGAGGHAQGAEPEQSDGNE